MDVLEKRVEKGAKFLDKVRPGWVPRIRLARLSLKNRGSCILGQLYGDYHVGVEKILNGDENRAFALGFNLDPNNYYYAELDKAWAFEIGRRRGLR